MAAPSFIQEAETSWASTNSTTITTGSFSVLAGDILVAFSILSNWVDTDHNLTITGGSLTWTEQQTIRISSYCSLTLATAVVDSNKSMTVTSTRTGASALGFGLNVLTFRSSDGVGASSKTNVSSGAPTLNLTTTQANSAIVVANGDWNAIDGASRTWRTNAGALTEQTYALTATQATNYGGYHADAGAIATYAVGLSAPGAQKYSIAAVEVKGAASDTLYAQSIM